MLKQTTLRVGNRIAKPAAFRRLCVETLDTRSLVSTLVCQPPSGGCVLKPWEMSVYAQAESPAAFRRLCVETANPVPMCGRSFASRLQAAVC